MCRYTQLEKITMTLDIIGGMTLVATLLAKSFVFTNSLRISPAARIAVMAAIGAWAGMQIGLYQTGIFQTAFARSVVPLVGIMVALPLIVVGVAAAASGRLREILLAVPMQTLIALNTARVLGGFFLLLAVAGRLSGPFPISAGWGDVITGLWAVPLAIAALRGTASPSHVFAWNLFGAADLVAAIALGVMSAEGNPLQIFAAPGSEAAQHMPFLLIPTVLVPFWLIIHGIVFAQVWVGRATSSAVPSR
jgi:hypothetical protein